MAREKIQAELELQALAAIGEAMLFNSRGNPQAVMELRNQGNDFSPRMPCPRSFPNFATTPPTTLTGAFRGRHAYGWPEVKQSRT